MPFFIYLKRSGTLYMPNYWGLLKYSMTHHLLDFYGLWHLKIMGQLFMYGYEIIFNIFYFENKKTTYKTDSIV